MFSGCTVLLDNKKTELEGSKQEVSPAAGKNTEIVLVPCDTWKCVPTAFLVARIYFQGSCLSFVMTDEFSIRVAKITSRTGVLYTHNLSFCL